MIVKNIQDYEVIGWRAWFEKEQIFDSKTHNWENIPDDGVLIIVQYHKIIHPNTKERYRRTWSGVDYYWTTPESKLEVFCGDESPIERYPGAVIKRGKWVPVVEMETANEIARNTKEF